MATTVARETRKTSMQISTLEKLTHHLADDGAPAAVLLLIPIVVNPLELFVIVFDQRIQETCARITRLIDSCRGGLHTLLTGGS